MSQRTGPAAPRRYYRLIYLLVPLIATALTFSGLQHHSFLNWDDDVYVTQNPLIRSLSISNLLTIFSPHTLVSGSYQPVTILSFAVNYLLFGQDAHGYIATNILLHLVNVLLVFVFIRRMGGSERVASVCALLFGIHPMHVESVAWITGRKDLLCLAFYLGALLLYLRYRESTGRARVVFYCGMILLSVLALLSKSAAVTIPFVLLLLDWYFARRFSAVLIAEKLPLLLLSLVFGVLAINGQKVEGALDEYGHLGLLSRSAIGAYGYLFYLVKFIAPWKLSAFYPYPEFLVGPMRFPYCLLPLAIVATTGLVWCRRMKVVMFGACFFLINVVFILHFVPVGKVITADRFSYIAYIGLSFIVAWYFEKALLSPRLPRVATYAAGGLVALALGVGAYVRTGVWENTITFWKDVVATHPNPVACINLGSALEKAGDFRSAISNYDEAIRLDPMKPLHYYNRGLLLTRQWGASNGQPPDSGEIERGIADLRRVIASKPACREVPDVAVPVSNLRIGRAVESLGRSDEAIASFEQAIESARGDPTLGNLIIRNVLAMGRPDLAVRFYHETSDKIPFSMEQLNALSDYFMRNGRGPEAIGVAQKAFAMAKSSGQEQLAQAIRADISDMQKAYSFNLAGLRPISGNTRTARRS